MSVNLNILANKAIRGYADVDDISTAVDIYTSGSPYIIYAVNNDANIPVTGLPQQAQYCSQSILQVSQTSDFSAGVTQSFINCDSSSLSGSYLYYASFTDSDQPGGFLEDNKGFIYPLFDTTIDYNSVNAGIGKTYYFRNRKIADFGYQGEWSNVDSVNLMLPNNNGNQVLNQNTFQYLWEGKGYNNLDGKLWRNYPPTFISGTNPNAGGSPAVFPFDATGSITIGSGNPEVIMWGNGGSPAIKTNGATFVLPMDTSLVQLNTVFTLCILSGSVIVESNNVANNKQLYVSASCDTNSVFVRVTGGTQTRTITLNPTKLSNNPIGVSSRVSVVSPNAEGFFNVSCAGLTGTEQFWQSPNSDFSLSGPFTIYTSNNCIFRFVGCQPSAANGFFPNFVARYFSIYGDYSGSLNG